MGGYTHTFLITFSFGDNGQIVMHGRMACQDMLLKPPSSCLAHVTGGGKFDGLPYIQMLDVAKFLLRIEKVLLD